MRRFAAVLLLLIIALVAAFAVDRPLPRADLTIIDAVDNQTLDPQRMSYMQDNRMCYAIYEGLVRWDTFDPAFPVVPALARSWEVSPDATVYTFHLEPSAKWSNGDPVRASDFQYSWLRAIIPDGATDYTASILFRIKGAQALSDFRTAQLAEYAKLPAQQHTSDAARQLRDDLIKRYHETVGVEALDDHTLRVTLERPVTFFLDLLAFSTMSPVHPPTVEKYVRVNPSSGGIEQDQGWTKPPVIVTNGPYRVVSWRFKRGLRLEANPHYWNPSLVRSRTVEVIPIEDQNTAVLAFKTGVADMHIDTDVDYIPELLEAKARGELDWIQPCETFGTYFWSFNCTPTLTDGRPNPFHDARVRRAFAMAVNKEALARKIKRSGEQVTSVLVPEGTVPGFKSPAGLPYDVDRAKQELAAAGWIDRDGDGVPENTAGEPFPTIMMLVTAVQFHRDVGLAMGRMWNKAFGVKTELVQKETKVYTAALDKRDYMLARGGWYGDFGDPLTFLDLHRTGDGNNDRGYSNPRYDAMLDAAERETDPRKRLDILQEAERYTMEEELPVLPVWRYRHFYLFHPPTKPDGSPNPGGLRGVSMHPRLVQYLWNLEVVR